MSRLRRNSISLGIGKSEVYAVSRNTAHTPTALQISDYLSGAALSTTENWARLLEATLTRAGGKQGGNVELTVSDAWARYFALDVPTGVDSVATLRALAANRFETLFGTGTKGWRLEADWKASGHVLVCALPENLVSAAQSLQDSGAWRVRSIQPYAIRVLSHVRLQAPEDCWICCFASHGVTAILVNAGEVCHARRFSFAEAPSTEAVQMQLVAEMLRLGLSSPKHMCVAGMLPEIPAGGRIGKLKLSVLQLPEALNEQFAVTEGEYLAKLGILV